MEQLENLLIKVFSKEIPNKIVNLAELDLLLEPSTKD
jgi:hypothetical protein